MAIIRWDPWRDFTGLQERINRMFDEAMRPLTPRGEGEELERGAWAPAVDIYETDNEYVVYADLPGVKKEEISIELKDNTLTLRGEKKFEEKVERDNYLRVERSYGTFVRSFTVPHGVEADKIKARFKDGVLELTIPKREEAKPKQIKVEVD